MNASWAELISPNSSSARACPLPILAAIMVRTMTCDTAKRAQVSERKGKVAPDYKTSQRRSERDHNTTKL